MVTRRALLAAPALAAQAARGAVYGHPLASKAGEAILAQGGTAIDAIVAGALVCGVTALQSCGIGGYGGHAVIAVGGKVGTVDFNTMAPAAMRPDAFESNARAMRHGWLASGVPGTMAGLEIILAKFGTMKLRDVIEPALRYASEGFEVTAGAAASIKNLSATLGADEGSANLLLPGGRPPAAGDMLRNPRLARLLERFAKDNSAQEMYRGKAARIIGAAFHKHGGLVTARDMAAYRARVIDPLRVEWRGYTVHFAPLTAGGITVAQAMRALEAMQWEKLPAGRPHAFHRIEAMRLAWHDRLALLGDPEKAKVPAGRLMSAAYAEESAARVRKAVESRTLLSLGTDGRTQSGTVNLSAADSKGNMAALTLTHGDGFGACVTVDELGLILGHGMSRFDPSPQHPNAPAPHKRPLTNMCPAIVTKNGAPVLAIGAQGGRRIPNAVYDVLTRYVGEDMPVEQAMNAPRMHTEGGLKLGLTAKWSDDDVAWFRLLGYDAGRGTSAGVSAASFDATTGAVDGLSNI